MLCYIICSSYLILTPTVSNLKLHAVWSCVASGVWIRCELEMKRGWREQIKNLISSAYLSKIPPRPLWATHKDEDKSNVSSWCDVRGRRDFQYLCLTSVRRLHVRPRLDKDVLTQDVIKSHDDRAVLEPKYYPPVKPWNKKNHVCLTLYFS